MKHQRLKLFITDWQAECAQHMVFYAIYWAVKKEIKNSYITILSFTVCDAINFFFFLFLSRSSMFVCTKQSFFVINGEKIVYRTASTAILTQSILESKFFVAFCFYFLACAKASFAKKQMRVILFLLMFTEFALNLKTALIWCQNSFPL